TFKRNATNTPVYLLATENVTVAGGISIVGEDGKPTGTYGDGALGDDGLPGAGGPGGFDGGRGGRDDPQLRAAVIRGGSGLGPGGGKGGLNGGDGCGADRSISYFKGAAGGGAYASNTFGYYASSYCNSLPATDASASGRQYGSSLLQPLIGGSGGGGGRGGVSYPGAGGGGGGGALLIAASGTLTVSGTINASGGDAAGFSGTGGGDWGAGGSGGAIRLVASTISGSGNLYAPGGCTNYNNSRRQYCGNTGSSNARGGSPGRIRLEADSITFKGTSDPVYSKDVPGPVFLADVPALRIASVGAQNVPANPTGNADVTLPADTVEAVPVTFQTTNVPVGNTVLLRVVPAYGSPVEVISPAITGSTASGTASVSVVLPSGPSTLQATTTYTVVVAGALDLSRFARNEAVEKVEVTVSLQGGTRARVLTAGGKAYEVAYRDLQAAGFRG